MPPRNPWLAESVYPTSHFNPGATDSVLFAGPVHGRKLTTEEVKTVPTVITSNPTLKKVGDQTIAFASGAVGVQKLRLTGKTMEAGNFVPYPGFEADAKMASNESIRAVLDKLDAASRARDESQIVTALATMGSMGLNIQTGINGVYNLFDKDGYHYCVFGRTKVLKSFDDNDPEADLRIVASKNLVEDLPADIAKSVSRIIGLAMTYDGYLAAAAPGAALILDRDLNVKSYVGFGDEAVDNSICIDDKGGVYVVTSKRMLRLAWTGEKLSTDTADGAWESPYESMDPKKAMALGAISRGSGTTPTLMGFGDDPDKLIVIADAAEAGTNLVAFWRDAIPDGFQQKPGTLSRRIADQIKIHISSLTIEPSPNVLGYGVAVINGSYPEPFPEPGPPNQFTAGVTRKAPLGVQKFTWDPKQKKFEKAWVNMEVDNTDIMVPVVSAATNLIYCATKIAGNYAYVGLDWTTGETKQTWLFPDDSRKWNALGGITTILEDGDLLIGGAFAIKRMIDAP
ncbi:hypothetical protein GF108_09945 [Phyllobacterium sp. SYP-B3895]|uniref:hypothetical protein n=1 Tax=Phyllobacterium sp. SYP-B3895 TaxID=2663240 RepID=UPI00129A00D7|nr:hypothetical protein [Phyllobacterium sp. SYP-B3895]MRG55903.1 hypothetical protein [Phyllobacterium sp. SYP-B3895]